MNSDYFKYLKNRSYLGILLRRLLLRPIVGYFSGKVLDIGTGLGEFLQYYRDSVGIDTNEDCVHFCNSRGLRCIKANVYNLPFSNGSFDGVLLNNVLEHLEMPDTVFSEIKSVLKKGGKLAIELPGKKGFYHDKTHVTFWDKENIIYFLKRWGFGNIVTNYFPIPFRIAGEIFTHNKIRVFAVNREDIQEEK